MTKFNEFSSLLFESNFTYGNSVSRAPYTRTAHLGGHGLMGGGDIQLCWGYLRPLMKPCMSVKCSIDFHISVTCGHQDNDTMNNEMDEMVATHMVVGLRSTSYEGKLRELKLPSLRKGGCVVT